MKPPKPKRFDSPIPWDCVILAIDPGQHGGCALYSAGRLFAYGSAESEQWAELAYRWAGGDSGKPLVVAIEEWNAHGAWSHKAKMGLAENVGACKASIAKLPRRKPTTKIVRIHVDEWRRAIYGKARGRDVDWKAKAIATVRARHKVDTADHNVAEAILLGEYATKCWKVGELPGIGPVSKRAEK